MKSLITAAALAALLAASTAAQAQILRWASQGDPQTMDPHSQNEGLTNQINGQVYEGLVSRDRQLNIVPALATSCFTPRCPATPTRSRTCAYARRCITRSTSRR